MADNNNVTLDAKPVTGTAYITFGGPASLISYSVDPADTPLLFRLRALALTNPVNRYFFCRVLFSGLSWVPGDTLTIYGRTFAAARYPAAGEFFDSAAADLSTVVDSICVAVNEDPFLGTLYSATRYEQGGGIWLEIVAKQQGTPFNLVIGDTITGTIPGFDAAVALTPTYDTNRAQQLQQWGYGFMLKVLVPSQPLNVFDSANIGPGAARWYEIASLAKDYGGSPTADFDVSRYVRPYATIPLPDTTTALLQRFPTAAAAYKVQWGEYFRGGLDTSITPHMPALALDNPDFNQTQPIFYRSGESEIRWAAPGAFRLDAVPADYYRWWRSVRNVAPNQNGYSTVPPVTERPASALVRRTMEPSWLYFWLIVDKRNSTYFVRMRYAITYHDGTTGASTSGIMSATDSGLFAMPCTPNLVTAEAGGKRVASWTATVEVRRAIPTYVALCSQAFTLDTTTDPKRYRTFYWENRFGTLDCFTFEGVEQSATDKAQVTYGRGISQQRGLNSAVGKTRVFESQTLTKQAVVSGWVDRAHMDYLAGMLRARNVYIVELVNYYDEAAGQQLTKRVFTSVVLGSHQWNADDREKLFNLGIEWMRAVPEPVLQA